MNEAITVIASCPYCNQTSERTPWRRRGDGPEDMPPTASVRCASCGAFFSVFRADPTLTYLSTLGVYFVECAGFIKIGLSSDWTYRCKTLEAANPLSLTLIGVLPTSPDSMQDARMVERALHARFASIRHRFEWFRGDPALRDWIAAHALKPELFIRAAAVVSRPFEERES